MLPSLHPTGPDRGSLHGTAVSLRGRALLIVGPSGSGKSGCAAQLMGQGAELIVDDRVVLDRRGADLWASAPEGAPAAMELRGLGILPVPLAAAAPVQAAILLSDSPARLPEPEVWPLLGRSIPLLRHPASGDLAAKLLLWLRFAEPGGRH
ncbi:HPr kinase/phosphorylase [Jannaschia sp. M317]|uniref:HPr kinase/phosphorylase n=1 Tax=Jannaschia sp. M317 TaxID=2867011 RepID=UPI0021A45CDB|nr:serine kinase [Jannaschia sp. M317]UWQ17376.1 serine kinase [Jannaschia sp. M317]